MATIQLSNDGYYVSGTQNVNDKLPFIITTANSGGTANTYTLPGTVVGQVPGGPPAESYFTVINTSANTQTFAAPTGFTLQGVTSLAAGNTTATKATFYYLGNFVYAGFSP